MSQPGLSVDDFAGWMRELYQYEPFPWQRRLLDTVLREGWPRHLSLPTGAGKTSVIDVALFALATEAAQRPAKRRMPLRIVLVVDRRVVVDAAYARARHVADVLARAALGEVDGKPVAVRVAKALRDAFGSDSPVDVALLRGGIYREDRWVRNPMQPTVVCSTVDQVGSRLLFRGYGVSPRTWPIHAGLLANDALIVLDEAHLITAFEQTLAAIEGLRRVRRDSSKAGVDLPWHIVSMTATHRHAVHDGFSLSSEDTDHPVLGPRLRSSKPIELVNAKTNDDTGFGRVVVKQVQRLLGEEGVRAILVVVNRVGTARVIADLLRSSPASPSGAGRQRRAARVPAPDILLLTGRSRPVARADLIEAHADRIMARPTRRQRNESGAPLVVVATQCVEVGADFDADALVTEVCPIDALVQRLGRLNRLGELRAAPCVVVARKQHTSIPKSAKAADPVYGVSAHRTWKWLLALEPLDGSILSLQAAITALAEDNFRAMCSPADRAPTLLPAYCDLWAQTAPPPAAEPDPALFLHGARPRSAEVQVVWRADLGQDTSSWPETVALCPPVVGEALPLRLYAVRQWLASQPVEDQPDSAASTDAGLEAQGAGLPFLRWRGPDDALVATDLELIRPGDTIVVPARYGGCDEFGWAPGSNAPVEDIADRARVLARRAPVVRLHPSLWSSGEPLPSALEAAIGCDTSRAPVDDEEIAERDELVGNAIDALRAMAASEGEVPAPLAPWREAVARWDAHDWRVLPHPSGRGFVFVARAGIAHEFVDFTDEDDTSVSAPWGLPLADHLDDVRRAARSFCKAIGLAPDLVRAVETAAWLHDLGKADPRFQAWMHGGDFGPVARGEFVAKSPRVVPGSAASRRARRQAGYPDGYRHELLSDALLRRSGAALLEGVSDRDLVAHLIASHHGWCRPFAPVAPDEHPVTVRWKVGDVVLEGTTRVESYAVYSGVAERFYRLVDRYGWWGLAFLEACVRLADWRASARGAKRPRRGATHGGQRTGRVGMAATHLRGFGPC